MLAFKQVTNKKPLMTGAMSAYPYDEVLDNLFKFKAAFDDEEVRGAVKQGKTLWVPREAVPYAEPKNDYRVRYEPVAIDCSKLKFRHEQEGLCKQSVELLRQGRSHIFEASTGHGKTVEGGYIAAKLGQPTMIVVTKDDLTTQWEISLRDVLGIPVNRIGHVQQDVCDWENKWFVVGMVQSLIIPDRYPQAMYDYFGMLILDEVHQMAADCFVRACQMFRAYYRLGFSATPDRRDGKTQLLYWHIGPTLVRGKVVAMQPKILVRQTGWRVPTRRKLVGNSWEQVPIPYSPGRMMLVNKAMASSDARNLEIVNFVRQAYDAGRRVLIMSDLRDSHLGRLFQMLTNAGIPGNDIGYYVGQMKKLELSLSKVKRVILATYKMVSTGTDVPIWDTLVMATPRADVKQAIGRVLRSADGKRQPVILDLVDYDSIFQNFHLSRLKQYYAVGTTDIVRMK